MKLFKKISSWGLIISILFSLSTPFAYAGLADMSPSAAAKEAMNSIMSMFGAGDSQTKSEISNLVSTGKVARLKVVPPQVSVIFTPSNPTPNSKVTATAQPTYFMNDATKMYYTWYIKHSYCHTTDDKTSKDYNSKCDIDNNGKVNIDDYKMEAMRIIANNDFDWNKALGKDSSNCSASGLKPDYCNQDDQYLTAADDKDGYKAIFGGDDQHGKESVQTHCYMADYANGGDYELPECKHLFPNAPDKTTGDGSFGLDEEKFWHTNPNASDTSGGGTTDEASVAGLGRLDFTWNYQQGDKVGVVVEGTAVESTQYADSSYKVMWALPKNKCDISDTMADAPKDSGPTATTQTTIDPTTKDKTVVTTTVTVNVTDDSINAISTVVTTTKVDTAFYSAIISTDFFGNTTISYPASPTSSSSNTTSSTKTVKRFQMKVSDLNQCLEGNLLDINEGGQSKNLTVDLSAIPDNPVNDPNTTDSGDELVVQSSIIDADNSNNIKYNWQVYMSADPNPDNWGNPLLKSELPGTKQTMGTGLQALRIRLNFDKDFLETKLGKPISQIRAFYLKVRLDASENVSKDQTRDGHNDIIIPVTSSSNKIKVYSPSVSYDAEHNPILGMDTSAEKCSDGLSSVICPVAKDEIVGMQISDEGGKLSNFSWTSNGDVLAPFSYDETQGKCLSGECDGKNGESNNTMFFPILKAEGAKYNIEVSADDTSTGERVSFTKTFEVVSPTIKVISSDPATAAPVLLGCYTDLTTDAAAIAQNCTDETKTDYQKFRDYSDDSFKAVTGATVKLKADFGGADISPDNYFWVIDGAGVNKSNSYSSGTDFYTVSDTGELSFTAAKPIGNSYLISVNGIYAPSKDIKLALNKYWGVQLNEFYEKNISKQVQLTVSDSLNGTAVVAQNKKFLASLFTELPTYLSFLFRLILTTALILSTIWVLLSIIPKPNED